MAQKEPEKSADKLELDALLDDALNDFETDQPDTSGRPPSSSSAPAQTDRQGPAPSKGKGLAFDPLQKPKGKRVHTHPPAPATAAAAGPFGGFGGGFGAIPPDIADQDDISAGFQRMMAELAQVDLSQRQTPRPMAEPPIPGDHDLAATLRALAAKSSSFGGGANAQGGALVPDGLNSDMLNKLTEQLNALGEAATGGVPGGQEGSSEDMSGLVDGIMHQLLAKDVLYQPIQEIGARYPQWLTDHRAKLSPEDLERYSQQFEHIQQISQLYEQEPENFPKLINLLQQMQACGQPPQEIVDEMAPGLQFDAQGQPQLPAGLGGLGSLGGLGIPGLSGNSGSAAGANCSIQ